MASTDEENRTESIDPKEVDGFSKFDLTWWDEKGKTKLLHKMNAVRVPFLDDCLVRDGHVNEGDAASRSKVHVLDVGCGGGIMTESVARMGYKVTGIDPSEELISVAEEHASKAEDGLEIAYLKTTIEEHSAAHAEKYDAIVASEVAEHVSDTRPLLHSCAAALKPGGSLVITTINRTFIAWLIYIVLFEYILRIIQIGTHQYKRLVKPEEIEEQLKEVNCSVVRVKGMIFSPFNSKWYWIPTVKICYSLHAVKNK